jgi:hypothetical protein
MSNEGSFPRSKRPRHAANQAPPSSKKIKDACIILLHPHVLIAWCLTVGTTLQDTDFKRNALLTSMNCVSSWSVRDMVCLWYIGNNSRFFQTQQFIPCFINTSCNEEKKLILHTIQSIFYMGKSSKRMETKKHRIRK